MHIHPLIVVGLAAIAVALAGLFWLLATPLARLFVWCVLHIFFKVRIVGGSRLPKTGAGLIVSNHVSYADAILIGSATPRFIRFLMWQPLFDNKWLNPFCRLFRAIPVPTGSPQKSLRALRDARRELEKGELVGIFPEGELTRTGDVKPFERGVELIARGFETNPVIPVYIHGLWGHALSMKDGRPFASRLRLRQPVTVCIGEPVKGPVSAEQLHLRVLELGGEANGVRHAS
ncbi:MAG: 1-acyl-sn-glycerol-3-phosphate acyltransferase [Bryobacteraceae bacterium]|jgi:acyl-[acyl-carrier-protein]-phospholipid O-acyltransferase/long-chain-fatty-acid--[acyl-carrier-protein] ligase